VRRFILAVVTSAALLLAAQPGSAYTLRHPHREHCRRGYVRKHRRECVRVKRTATHPAVPAPSVAPRPVTPSEGSIEEWQPHEVTEAELEAIRAEGESCELPSELAECARDEQEFIREVTREEQEEES